MHGNTGQQAPARVFVGRVAELDALATALDAARAGHPQVVLIQGDAGIGKSSLVFEFLRRQPGVPVITASGDMAEQVLPYGVTQQLAAGAAALGPAGADRQPPSPGSRPDADPLAVGVDLLALLAALPPPARARLRRPRGLGPGGPAASGEQAAVAVVEDLQWADLPSARALLFACRRLTTDRVLVLLTSRAGQERQLGEGWARFVRGDHRVSALTLNGLDVSELSQLCRELGRASLPERALARLAEHTGGNPLLARALLAELTDEGLRASGGFFRAPRSVAGIILPRLAVLPRAVRDLVLAAAVLGDRSALDDVAAVAGTADPTGALGKAERAGFLVERSVPLGREVSFAHPLIRQAVYGDLRPERRRQLHLRAAAVVGAGEALAHRAAAAVGPDPALAAALAAAAATADGAGRPLLAAALLQQAATVTGRGPERDELALSAFELLVRAADVAAAESARPAIEQLPASARRDTALGQLALLAARPGDAQSLLRSAWDGFHRSGPEAAADPRAGEAALGLGTLLAMAGSFREATVWLDRALAGGDGSEPWYDAACCVRSFMFALAGDIALALALFLDLPPAAALVPAARTDALTYRGAARLWSGDLQAAAEDLATVVSRINAGLQVRFPSSPQAFLAEAEFRLGRWDEASAHAELAVALATDADRDYDLPLVHSIAGSVPACRGDWAVAAGHAQAAEQVARKLGGFAAVFAASARALLGFARDDPDEVLRGAELALAVPEIDRYDDPAVFWWRPLQVWALIRAGGLGEAEAILAAFESRATGRGQRAALVPAAWLRGCLAAARGDLGQADRALRAGRRAARGLRLPFWCGVLDLEHGRCLARQQRPGAAEALRAARGIFARLQARPFLQAAEAELAALGERRKADGGVTQPGLPGLSAQELRVARLVASGLSNREAAALLYLSPKTVEYHLSHAFAKLGVRTRHQLTARIGPGDTPGVPA